MNTQQLDHTYIANTYARYPVTIVRGKGSLVWDENGKEYIDLATGIAVNSFGVSDPAWVRAVTEQLCTVQHTSNLYFTAPDAQLAQLLCEKTGMKKVFFSNSGAEANECAIKAARKYAAEHKGPEYHTIITLKNSFHGRTITTLAATGQDVFHHDFLPLTEGFAYAEANDLDDLKAQVAAHKCAAIMIEVVQGEGGVIPLTQEFVKGAAQLAAAQDILLICVFGGLINGFSISLCLQARITSGGTDFIALWVSNHTGKTIWGVIFGFNCFILAIFGFMFGWDNAAYSIVFQFISTKTIDSFYHRYDRVTLQITTRKADEVMTAYVDHFQHGISCAEVIGGYSREKMYLLHTVVSTYESQDIIKLVCDIDPGAVINVFHTLSFVGGWWGGHVDEPMPTAVPDPDKPARMASRQARLSEQDSLQQDDGK